MLNSSESNFHEEKKELTFATFQNCTQTYNFYNLRQHIYIFMKKYIHKKYIWDVQISLNE